MPLPPGFFLFLFFAASTIAQFQRTKYNFNSDWRLHIGDIDNAQNPSLNDSTWKPITTPHAWNEDDAFKVSIDELPTGIAWYRKHFQPPASAKDRKIFLEFEGIRHGGEFYLNGQWIGRSENGVMAFGFDVSSSVKPDQDNVVAARIDNSWEYREVAGGTNQRFQWNDKNFYANYGGINKNVFLHVTDRLHQTLPLYSNLNTTGVYVYADKIDVAGRTADVTAQSEVKNAYNSSKTFSYSVEVSDASGKPVKSFKGTSFTLKVNETRTVSASSTTSGLNFWSWGYGYLYDVRTILSINGTEVDSVTTRTGFRKTEFKNGMFKLNDRALHLKGYAQRTTNEWVALGSAVPAWLSDFSNQLVLRSNGNLIRWMHVTPWKQDVESFDRLGILQAMPAGDSEGDVTGRRWEQRKELMRDAIVYNRNNPSIVFYEGGNHGITEDHMKELNEIRDLYDPKGGRASGSREMLDSKVAEFGGEMLYINKGSNIPYWQMEYSRDEGLRKYWDNYSPPYHPDGEGAGVGAIYNRNQDTHAIENVVRWYDYYEQRPGTGTRVNAGGVNIIFSDSNTHHRGVENYRRSGEVDAVRLPKDGWYAHKVMWDGWVDVEKSATHIIGHWKYNATTVKNVTVVSTAEKVELKLNGNSLGEGVQSQRFLFTFANVKWSAGTLEAVGYTAGSVSSSDKRTTSGQAAAIKLSSHVSPNGFRADGADIALVDIEVVDSSGQRVPTALNTISFKLSGEAKWRGGIAQGPDNYILSKTLPVENGVNRVLLRSTTKSGTVSLEASSQGLTSASITLTTKDFPTTNGLSTILPSSNLPSDLSRGPTPSSSSYKPSRQALKITSVTAGSNAANTSFTYDDTETTSWAGADAATSWIRYTLSEASVINQLVMKLSGFRTKTYSLSVLVDEKVVWKGTTETNLGYVTLKLEENRGKSVEIKLEGGKGTLAVVEAEIYRTL
ncbi:glycoside hydrolase family 2 sugar binding protein [Byssothecium circinans]|uniref:Glycoside hydrolase family 2 sugar binding protein n=1 Tax=Byssothecium circinans TaxID=147558 RepID=A0A6A5TIJ9_9PLEO|nr:glycoside hydrolase family 2 sugar binding protein [Byssothecium circinans]